MLASADVHAPNQSVSGLRDTLLQDHERLEKLLRELLARARAGDAPDLVTAWRDFEEGLRAHLTAEEEELFPLYSLVHPEEIRSLRREHAELRALLDTAGFGVELHSMRLRMLEDLAERLREHAKREDDSLYRFADETSPTIWYRLRHRLASAMRRAGATL